MRRNVLIASCIALTILFLNPVRAQSPAGPSQAGPYTPGYVTVTTTNPSTDSELVTDIYYPASDSSVDPSGAPYATLVFAHGFMASPSGYSGYGEHLASWGYIVALPDFPDEDIEVRVVEHMFRWVEWKLLEQSHEHEKLDSKTIEFRVPVEANGETTVTYTVRYEW